MALKRRGIKITQDFYDCVQDYAKARGYKSWNKALVELASIGLVHSERKMPSIAAGWGGDRKSAEYKSW